MRPSIKNSRVLITGGAGFIGSHLADRLLKESATEVVIIDNMFLGKKANLERAEKLGAKLYIDDATKIDVLRDIIKKHKINIVFNCATKALNYSFIDPLDAYTVNTQITLNLLELQRTNSFNTLCHFSTSEVYGSAVYEPMDEKHPMHPTTTYAAGKAAADLALESYVKMFNLDAFIVRPFNNYGPRQNYEGSLAAIIPVTVLKILNDEPPEIHGTGLQSRDFIYVEDTIDTVIKLYNKMPAGDSVNISTNCQLTINNVVESICEILNYKNEILRKPARKADVITHHASNEKIQSMIEYQLTPFQKGLIKTVNWYKEVIQPKGAINC